MNIEWSDMTVLLECGVEVEVTARNGKNKMRGKLTKAVMSDHETFAIMLDGAGHSVSLHRADWDIQEVEPEIESGIYVGIGNIYRVDDKDIRGTDVGMRRTPMRTMFKRKVFARMIEQGKVRRVAPLDGTW